MNDDITTQSSPAPIVLKLKKYDDIILPHTSRLSTDTINDNSPTSFETPLITTVSPSTLRVKLKKSLRNGDDDDFTNSNLSDSTSRPAKRSKKSSSNDYLSDEQNSSQFEMNEIKSEPPLVVKIRRDSLSSNLGSPLTTTETDLNRQLLLKLKKNEHGEITTSSISPDMTSNNFEQNGDHQPHITNMLSNLNDDKQWNDQLTTTNSQVLSSAAETHTKELLDEALDSVKNVLMQSFRKNLESGGNLDALKMTLGSDEVAEVFLSKLRESLKRETISTTNENEQIHPNKIISPIMNVVSPSPSPSPLPSISTIINKSSSPQPTTTTTTTNNNNKRKSMNATTTATNPNRFDGTSEEELSKRCLSDILQPNLDIVFVGINPSLYAVHKGHHYGGPGNHFWKLLHMSDLIPTPFTPDDDFRMPEYGIGFTNIVQRPSKAGSDITKDEVTAGAEVLAQKIKKYRPKIVAFNGRGIYEVYAGNKHFHYGKQPDLFPETETHVFVMPSSSARCSQLPRAEDKLPFYIGLKKLRDFVNGKILSLNEAEITFPDIKIKDTDDVLQKTIIRISNKPFSEFSPEILKTFGDKIPSAQLTSKFHQHDSLPTQTMSILQNENMNKSESNLVMNETDAAVLAALASGTGNSSKQLQTIFIGKQPTIKTNSSSHTIHHLPQTISSEPQTSSVSQLSSSNSQFVSHQIVVLNPTEQRSTTLKDLLSSQQSTSKSTFLIPTNSNSVKTNSSDDCFYLRYERQQPPSSSSPSTTTNSFHFSYVIDEYSSTINKQLRYVSINDL